MPAFSLDAEQAAPLEPPEDVDWNTTVPLLLEPNPGLPEAHRRIIELDYGMESGEVRFDCRRALLLYVMRNLGLDDVDGEGAQSPTNRIEEPFRGRVLPSK